MEYGFCRWQWNPCWKITSLANASSGLEMQPEIKFSSKTEYFQVYKKQDNAMFGNLLCEIELRSGVMF